MKSIQYSFPEFIADYSYGYHWVVRYKRSLKSHMSHAISANVDDVCNSFFFFLSHLKVIKGITPDMLITKDW